MTVVMNGQFILGDEENLVALNRSGGSTTL